MELFWYIAAAILAGIGTGLAGLSAATVMVPILIVLCPSFAAENGVYQATAIALASDILGSAVTSYTYYRSGNIDLHRGRIMFFCIVLMCTAGSYAAYLAGNVVLGNFTLFLTLAIGIRFLIKPDSSAGNAGASSSFGLKEILISLFFGLTIGFGTGFVGTGGGMMMLVVFTMFLGMDLKTAVGTSTFIMTFTALIAAVSHIIINPAIIFERSEVMLVCIVFSTVSGLLSARFANRVSGRTIGLCTGAFLTILGISLLTLHYREFLAGIPLLQTTLTALLRYFSFVIPAALLLFTMSLVFRIPKNIFRKLLHIVAFLSPVFLALYGPSWQADALTMILVAVIVWPVLSLAESLPLYKELFAEKKPGEIKASLLLLFFSQAALTAFSLGVMHKPYILIASCLAWGFGDIAAAWVGRPFGKHKIRLKIADPHKSWEGSAAMFAVSSAAALFSLLLFSDYALLPAVFVSLLTGLVSSFSELCSKNGNDTVIVPAADVLLLSLLTLI